MEVCQKLFVIDRRYKQLVSRVASLPNHSVFDTYCIRHRARNFTPCEDPQRPSKPAFSLSLLKSDVGVLYRNDMTDLQGRIFQVLVA